MLHPKNNKRDQSKNRRGKTAFFSPALIYPKLTIGPANDAYEQEADAMAEQVMRAPLISSSVAASDGEEPDLQRKCESCEKEEQGTLQRKGEEEEEENLQLKRDPLMRKPDGQGYEAGPSITDQLQSSKGGGQPLPDPTARQLGSFFQTDLSNVRIHTGQPAHQMNQQVRAKAFTHGSDIYFNEGQFQPNSAEGRGLIAHEVTHVLQQGSAGPGIQKAGANLAAGRFKGVTELEEALDNTRVIENPDSGLYVTILQQALVDSGIPLPIHGVDGVFGDETERAVKDFQRMKGLTGSDVDGDVGPITMGLLDDHFLHHQPEHDIATDSSRGLLDDTRTLSADDTAAFNAAITTEPRTSTGALPTFNRTVNGQNYEVRIRNRLNAAITSMHSRMVAGRPARVPGNLMGQADINRLADIAKQQTDAVYGRYNTGPALRWGVNIMDQFTARNNQINASTAAADAAANFRVKKLLEGDSRGPDNIAQIDQDHGAVQCRPTEWALIAAQTGFPNNPAFCANMSSVIPPPHITSGIVGSRRTELLDIHRNWPASADHRTGTIFIQRFLGSNDLESRDIMYKTLGIFIHEYLHTLEHHDSRTYRQSLPGQRGGFVLREGMTDYLAKIVWENIQWTNALKALVEDRFQDPVNPNGHPIPTPNRYPQWRHAARAAGIVGIRNAMAAFFLGRTDLIGGP